MSRYIFVVAVVLWKKGPMTQPFIRQHQIFILCVSLLCSITTWGFLHPHMRQLYLLTLPHRWKFTSSEK
jgi:hypothetical protein